MTDLNVKKEYLNLIYADCGKGSAGEKIKELVTVPGTQYLIFGVISVSYTHLTLPTIA